MYESASKGLFAFLKLASIDKEIDGDAAFPKGVMEPFLRLKIALE